MARLRYGSFSGLRLRVGGAGDGNRNLYRQLGRLRQLGAVRCWDCGRPGCGAVLAGVEVGIPSRRRACLRCVRSRRQRVKLAFGAYDHDAKGSTTNQEYYRVRGYSIAVWRVRVPGKVFGSSIGSCMVRGGSLLPRMAV